MAAISFVGFSKSLARKISHKFNQSFTLLTCLSLAFQPMMADLAYAQEIIIDPNGNVGFAPTIQRTSRPQVVDIARPNTGGVSLNQYTEFNVPDEGAVLNNSQGGATTQIAGAVAGNQNLQGGTASVIVNEVTSTGSSTLTGSIEVAGDRASVIIANPNGILCNGCNFINATDGTLTTGVPVIDGGNVRLDVTQGTVTIGRSGLKGGDANSSAALSNLNLIGRTVVIDGRVTAIDGINVQGGAQSYDLTAGRQVSTLTGVGSAPDLVVDGSVFGAMDAGRIQVIGNENGLGVRVLGAVQSSVTDVNIIAEGDTTVRSVAAQRKVHLQSRSGDLTIERDATSATSGVFAYARKDINTTDRTGLYGFSGVTVTSQSGVLSYRGVLQSGADATLYGRTQLSFSAYGSAEGDFSLRGLQEIVVEDSAIVANQMLADVGGGSFILNDSAIFSDENFNITTRDFFLGENVFVDGLTGSDVSNLVVTASGDFYNSADLRRHDTAEITYAGNLYNEVGGVIEDDNLRIAFDQEVHNAGILYGTTSLRLDVAALFNNETGVILSDRVNITTTGLLSNEGTITSEGDITLISGTKIVNDGYIQGIRAFLTAPEVVIGGGAELRARDYGRITAGTDFKNQGIIASNLSFRIDAGRFDNKGLISVDTSLAVYANTITNQDALTAGAAINLVATGDITNFGTLASYGNATLTSDSLVVNQGMILADGNLVVYGPWFENRGVDALVRAKTGSIRTNNIRNSGKVYLISGFQRRGDIDFFENDGVFASQGKVEISGRDASSSAILREGSTLIAGLQPNDVTQELLLGSSAILSFADFTVDGRIAAGGSITLSGPNTLLINGTLEARQDVSLTADAIAVSALGTIQAERRGIITTSGGFTNDGIIVLDSYLRLAGGVTQFTNNNYIASAGTNQFTINGNFENAGVFQSSARLDITAQNLTNRGHLQSADHMYLTANRTSVNTLGETVVTLGSLNNYGSISSGAYAYLTGGYVRLDTGSYLAAEQLRLTADAFDMKGRAVLAGASRNDWTVAQRYRQYGTLFSTGELRVYADSFQSFDESNLGSSGNLTLNVTALARFAGSLSANRVTVDAAEIAGSTTSSIFASDDLRLTAASGKVGHQGELVAGEDLYVTSNSFDIRGGAFAKRVYLDGVDRGDTRGNLYGSETVNIVVTDGAYNNFGLAEARNNLNITASAINNYAGGKLSSTEIDAQATTSILNSGEVFGASKIMLGAGDDITNMETGEITSVSLGLAAENLTNKGLIDVYGFFGDVNNKVQNFGFIEAETYFGLDTATFYNREGASLRSGGHVYVNASSLVSNYDTARIEATSIDVRAGSFTNSGRIAAQEVVNVADVTGNILNASTGTIYGKTIALVSNADLRNDGQIGRWWETETINLYGQTSVRNENIIWGDQIRIGSTGTIQNRSSGDITANEFLGIESSSNSVSNYGQLRGDTIRIEAQSNFLNEYLVAGTTEAFINTGGAITNRDGALTSSEIKASTVSLVAGLSINNSGVLFGYEKLALQAGSGNIQNGGSITGPDITLIAQNGGVYSTTGIYAGGTLAIEAQSIGLRGRVRVTDQVTLKTSRYDIEVDDRIETKRLLVDAARDIRSYAGAFRGTELTQLVADDISRFDGNVIASYIGIWGSPVPTKTGMLAVVGGTQKDIYVQLRQGSIGILGSSIGETIGHAYDAVNWDVTGSVSLIANSGSILLNGTVRTDGDLYIRAGDSTLLRSGTLDAGKVLHVEGRRYLKNYGGMQVTAANKVQLVQNYGWFYTDDWFSGDIAHNLSVQAKTIVVNSSNRLIGRDLYLLASDDIKQKDQVISARQITYSAGRDIFIRFNPLTWRANNSTAANTGDWWDMQSAGLRGHNLLSQGKGTTLYAGRDIALQSGKVHSGGSLSMTAGRSFLSEPIFLKNRRTNRPANVGWSFSSKYQGVVGGHDASKVTIDELRAYENQISAANDVTIVAGASANFIGSRITANNGDISIDTLAGGVNMVAAPGFWSYNYANRTTKKKLFGFYTKTTTYEYDAAEDIYKRATLQAANGNINIRATGGNSTYASILSAGTAFTAQNIYLYTPNGNISAGTYAERSIEREDTRSNTTIAWFIPFGSSDTTETNNVLVNYGSDFLADELLDIAAPSGTLSITGGTIRARTVNLTAARLEINAAINSAQQTYYSNRDNMITITTIQSGFDRETAQLPEIYAPTTNFNISGETHIQGYEGVTLNTQLINLIGSRQFDDATLGLASPADLANAENEAEEIDQQYIRSYDLPGASDGQQFAYLDTLIQDYGATYYTIELRDREWYDKQVQLNPAFKALLQVAATYVTGGINFGIENAFISAGVEAATTNIIVGVVEGSITGDLDMDDILRGAFLAGGSATISSYLSDQINWGAGLNDQSPFLNAPQFAPAAIVDRFGDQIVSQVVSNVVYGQDPFDGFDNLGRTFLVSETMALAQFGIGELGEGNANWEGSVGHLVLHGGVGCLALEALNGDCVAGFFAGASSSLLAGSNLTDEQILELSPLVGAFASFVASNGEAINVAYGSAINQSAIVNNFLTHANAAALEAEMRVCLEDANCDPQTIIDHYLMVARQNDVDLLINCGRDPICIDNILSEAANSSDFEFLIGERQDLFNDIEGSISPGFDVGEQQRAILDGTASVEVLEQAYCGGVVSLECNEILMQVSANRGLFLSAGLLVVGGTIVLAPPAAASCLATPACAAAYGAFEAAGNVSDLAACMGGNYVSCGAAAINAVTPGNFADELGDLAQATNRTPQVTINRQNGAEFEQQIIDAFGPVGGVKNTTPQTVTLSNGTEVTTIPDLWGRNVGGLLEAKNVQNLSLSPQLSAQAQIARESGQPMNLVVSPRTQRVSGPLLNDVRSTGGNVFVYNPATDSLTPWLI